MVPKKEDNEWLSKVEFLSEVLPYMHQYNGSSIVIKYGGHAMNMGSTTLHRHKIQRTNHTFETSAHIHLLR